MQTVRHAAPTGSATNRAAPSNVSHADDDVKQGYSSLVQQEPVSNLREGAPPSYDDVVRWNVTDNKTQPSPSALPFYPSTVHQDLPYPGTLQADMTLCLLAMYYTIWYVFDKWGWASFNIYVLIAKLYH